MRERMWDGEGGRRERGRGSEINEKIIDLVG